MPPFGNPARHAVGKQRHEQLRLRKKIAADEKIKETISEPKKAPEQSPLLRMASAIGLSDLSKKQQDLLLAAVTMPLVAVLAYRWHAQGVFSFDQ